MRFGIRDVANLTLRAKSKKKIGSATFEIGQPVLYIDTATTSSLEQAATTVYAQGGRGNARLIAWEGEKTLTLTFTDALLSPIGLSVLSGAGLFKETGTTVHYHMTSLATIDTDGKVDLSDAVADFDIDSTTKQYIAQVCTTDAPIYIMEVEEDGSLTGVKYTATSVTVTNTAGTDTTDPKEEVTFAGLGLTESTNVMLDYYVDLPGEMVYEADITTDELAGYYYVEGDVLVRRQDSGKDMPGSLTIPNAKLQSNFTITMASTGDPSTFDFTLDAFPGYTYFDKTKKVLAVVQIVDTAAAERAHGKPVMLHTDVIEHENPLTNDSNDEIPKKKLSDLDVPMTFSVVPESKLAAASATAEEIKNNNAVTLTQEGPIVTLTANLADMEPWTSTQTGQSYAEAPHYWVVLDIDTGTDDVTQFSYNGTQLDSSEDTLASQLGLDKGHLVYWTYLDEESSKTITFGNGEKSTTYTLKTVHSAG